MIKINDILNAETNSVNASLKTHYIKDITSYGVCELITKTDEEGTENTFPAVYKGRGNYESIQDDTKTLIVYHRILGFDNEEDLEAGFGRNSMTTETYEIKSVFYGQQPAIEDDNCEDINLYLAREFKKLVPRSLTLVDINRITVTGIEYDKTAIEEDEGLKIAPSNVAFALTLNIVIKSTENCTELSC